MTDTFNRMIDDLVVFSEHDDELKDGIKYIDIEARKKDISFYDMMYEILYQHDINERAKEWINNNATLIDWKERKNE